MSVTPPLSYGIFAVTYQPIGGARQAVNTWGFRNSAGVSAAACLSNFSAAFFSSSRPYHISKLADTWELVQQYCIINTGTGLFSDTQIIGTPGTRASAAPPPNVSAVIQKVTASAGRQYRGRVAFPAGFLVEDDIDNTGSIDPTVRASMLTAFESAMNDATTNSVPVHLLHGPNLGGVTPAPTLVTDLRPDSLVGTQRRRMRR